MVLYSEFFFCLKEFGQQSGSKDTKEISICFGLYVTSELFLNSFTNLRQCQRNNGPLIIIIDEK